jgi:MoaA/NifB/PqqE/SkfB family radical SAM enzyme
MCRHGLVEEIPVVIDIENLDPFLQRAGMITFSGGEPLWMSDKVNAFAKRLVDCLLRDYPKLQISSMSNGVLLSGKYLQLVLDHFKQICFSIDTLDPSLYGKIRGKPLLETVMRNVENLGRLKKKLGRGVNDRPQIQANSVIMNSTLEGLPNVANWVAQSGGTHYWTAKLIDMDKSGMARFFPMGDAESRKSRIPAMENENRRLSLMESETIRPDVFPGERLKSVGRRLREVSERTGLVIGDKSHFFTPQVKLPPSITEAVCPAPWETAFIHENGNVHCCCYNSVRLGNVNVHDFEDIWNGPAARELRESFQKGELKGCIRYGCESPIDYFAIPESYSENLVKNLGNGLAANGPIKSVLLLRTGPLYQSYLAARALLRRFPNARLTVVTNEEGRRGINFWGEGTELHVYPDGFLEPESFMNWWSGNGADGPYSLAAMIYNNADRKGYEPVEEIIRSIKAVSRIGIKPDGKTVRL